jgi:hypothetical protein
VRPRRSSHQAPGTTRDGDRGAVDALGLVLLAPAVIGLAVLVVALGRGVDAQAQVRSSAEAAAQAAALERGESDAVRAGRRAALAMLVDNDSCKHPEVVVDYPTRPAPNAGISNGIVAATVTCTVSSRGIAAVQSSDRSTTATAYATVDFFRFGPRP